MLSISVRKASGRLPSGLCLSKGGNGSPRLISVGLAPQGIDEVLERLRVPPQRHLDEAAVVVCLGVVGLERDRCLEEVQRVRLSACAFEGDPEVVVRLRVGRRESNRLPEIRQCRVKPPRRAARARSAHCRGWPA
jgi:hypothetical protein